MCHKVTCQHCKKASWSGCGRHIASALAGVKEADRCPGWKTAKCPAAPAGADPGPGDSGCAVM